MQIDVYNLFVWLDYMIRLNWQVAQNDHIHLFTCHRQQYINQWTQLTGKKTVDSGVINSTMCYMFCKCFCFAFSQTIWSKLKFLFLCWFGSAIDLDKTALPSKRVLSFYLFYNKYYAMSKTMKIWNDIKQLLIFVFLLMLRLVICFMYCFIETKEYIFLQKKFLRWNAFSSSWV